MTESFGQATVLAREAADSGFELVVAVGGDGTVNEVVNGIYSDQAQGLRSPLLGVIPLGSGCDLARTLALPKETTQIAKSLHNGHTTMVDVGRAEFVGLDGNICHRFFLNIADLGGGGVVVQRAARSPRILGKRPNYTWGIVMAALTYGAREIDLAIDGNGPFRVDARNVIIANGRYFGRGFHAAPRAKMDDGLFDIISVGNFGLLQGLRCVPKLYKGTHLELDKVEYYQAKRLEASSEKEVLLEMDGDLVGRLPAKFQIIPKALGLAGI